MEAEERLDGHTALERSRADRRRLCYDVTQEEMLVLVRSYIDAESRSLVLLILVSDEGVQIHEPGILVL